MKKWCVIVFVLALLLFAACSSPEPANTNESESQETAESTGNDSAVIDNRTTEEESDSTEEEVISVSDDEFAKEGYMYEGYFGDTFYFLVITNNSNATVGIGANGVAKDANGNLIGADSSEIDVLGPGEQSICYFYFNNVSNVASVDYDLNYSDSYYSPVIADLDMQYTINNQNVVVSVTNNGDKTAEFVKAYALFFDANGALVDHDDGYAIDNDDEIKPGNTSVVQLDTNDGFDTVKVFLTGRHYD